MVALSLSLSVAGTRSFSLDKLMCRKIDCVTGTCE